MVNVLELTSTSFLSLLQYEVLRVPIIRMPLVARRYFSYIIYSCSLCDGCGRCGESMIRDLEVDLFAHCTVRLKRNSLLA